MSEETLKVILTGGSKSMKGTGVGVRNVNERIELYYGREYGLSFESEIEEGTTVTLIFPALAKDQGNEGLKEDETSS
jgi:two-component system sensor histidine kinase YesM